MKINIHSVLIGVAFICGALIFYYSAHKGSSASPSAIGSKILPNLPVNRVGKIVITSKDGVTTVAKSREKWVVASRFNYPANFDKVADAIRELGELKVGQTVNANPSQLGAFNLVSPTSSGTNKQTDSGTLLELRDEKDGFLASLLIGKGFMRQQSAPSMETMMGFGGYSDGQYVESVEGKVYLVAKSLERMIEPAKTWLADDFIDAPSTDIKEITISGPDRAAIKLIPSAQAPRDGDSFTLADLRPEEGSLESTKINQITGALNRLGFDDVADPALTLKETGLDRPIVFKATTKDGLIYTLQLGNTLTNDTFDRYLIISVTNEPSADQRPTDKPKEESAKKEMEPAQALQLSEAHTSGQAQPGKAPEKKNASEQAAILNGMFGSWIYVIKSYRAEPILLTRNDLIKKPDPPKTEKAQTNVPPKNAEETGLMPASDKQSESVKKASEIKSKK